MHSFALKWVCLMHSNPTHTSVMRAHILPLQKNSHTLISENVRWTILLIRFAFPTLSYARMNDYLIYEHRDTAPPSLYVKGTAPPPFFLVQQCPVYSSPNNRKLHRLSPTEPPPLPYLKLLHRIHHHSKLNSVDCLPHHIKTSPLLLYLQILRHIPSNPNFVHIPPLFPSLHFHSPLRYYTIM